MTLILVHFSWMQTRRKAQFGSYIRNAVDSCLEENVVNGALEAISSFLSSNRFPPSITVHAVMQDILLVSILHCWTLPVDFHHPPLFIPWCMTSHWWVFSTLELFQWVLPSITVHTMMQDILLVNILHTWTHPVAFHQPSMFKSRCKTSYWWVLPTLKTLPVGFSPIITVHTIMWDILLVNILYS